MVEVPADGLLDAFLELQRGFPTQLLLQLGGVDGVSGIVTETIGDIGDEVQRMALGVAQQAVDSFDNDMDDIDILPLVETADIVGFSYPTLVKDDVNGTGVVLNEKPVAHVLALAIDGKGLALTDIVDEQGYQLLGELVGAVIVGTVGDNRGHTIGVMVGTHEVVARGL